MLSTLQAIELLFQDALLHHLGDAAGKMAERDRVGKLKIFKT